MFTFSVPNNDHEMLFYRRFLLCSSHNATTEVTISYYIARDNARLRDSIHNILTQCSTFIEERVVLAIVTRSDQDNIKLIVQEIIFTVLFNVNPR